MNFVNQEMQLNNNKNIPDLHAVKIELENIKIEPVSSIVCVATPFFYQIFRFL